MAKSTNTSKTAKNDLEKKEITQLHKELSANREELRKFRFGIAGAANKNVRATTVLKRDIARILTEVARREKTELSNSTAK